MKAAVYRRYGPSDVVEIEDVQKPSPKDSEVLLKVRAASVNPLDAGLMKGKPHSFRLLFGLRNPRLTRPGVDVAGQVERVGRNVTQFKPGDEVFGSCRGAFAEYACTRESKLVIKPAHVTFEQAASVPVAAFTALQGLRDKGHIQPGQKVLINSAAGGVGTFAVQIAKSFGAEVTGVCSTRNVDMVRSLGADQVIDYAQEDFTKNGQRYDLILAANGYHPISAYKRALSPKGMYVMTGGSMAQLYQAMLLGPLISMTGSNKMGNLLSRPNQKDLVCMKELLEAGKVVPVIDRRYPLSETAEAIHYVEKGHARGKVVITME